MKTSPPKKKLDLYNPLDMKLYQEEACQIAMVYLPPIYPCKKCNHPYIAGYCCSFCGDRNPEHEE